MARRLKSFFLRMEMRWHAVDAQLAHERGDILFAADCEARLDDCRRQLLLMRINQPRKI